MTDQLRECPFCGLKTAVLTWHTFDSKRWFGVTCNNGFCRCAISEYHADEAQAFAAWNTRPTSEREARLVEALNELRSCSRAKIGKDDDFACADKQMRDALAAYSETKP